ncbi:MAG TPA: hypothetical protein PK765_03595 [bacterium]|nr:hypothetical protein [bacterium]
MDLGAATTGRLMIDFDRYPLPGCRFAMTAGSLEPVPERKKKIFPRKDAVRIIVLHENHVRYFSSRQDRYEPFFLEPSECEIRPAMQEYFFQNYGLSISVRPVRWHGYRDGTPHMLANAQPQTGSADLRPYPRSDHAAWESSFFTSCDRE